MKNEINEHRLRLNILEKHISSDFYKTGHLHNKISDAMKEYAEQVNDVDTSQDQALNLADVTAMLPTKSDMENKVTDAKRHQANEHPKFIEGYELGYKHCYNWMKRIISLFGN